MSLSVPKLVLRLVKGSPLTMAEHDNNLTILKNFSNSLAALVAVSLNTDGTLKDDSVQEADIQDRQISARKLKLTALPFFVDEGSTNSFLINPDPAITAYENGMVVFVRALNSNTGPSVLKLNNLSNVPLRKLGGTELDPDDIKIRSVFIAVYYEGVFHLVSGAGASSSAGGNTNEIQTGIQRVEIDTDDDVPQIPAVGNTASKAHALGGMPSGVEVFLKCNITDGAFSAGDIVPLEFISDAGGADSFSVAIDASNIRVTRETAALQIGATVLTEANWSLLITGYITYNAAVNLQAAADITVPTPAAAYSYGNKLFIFNSGSSGGQGVVYIHKHDLTTNVVEMLENTPMADNPERLNAAPWRSPTDDLDYLYFTSLDGIYKLPLQDPDPSPWTPTKLNSVGLGTLLQGCKPVWVDETTPATPLIHCVQCSGYVAPEAGYAMDAIKLRTIDIGTGGGGGNGTLHANVLDLTDANIVNRTNFIKWYEGAASNARVMLFQYNPVKQRIYVITSEAGVMHVFKLNTVSNNIYDWWHNGGGAIDYTDLEYEKSLGLGGFGGVIDTNSGYRDRAVVEFDLGTGQEKAIVWVRSGGAANTTGSLNFGPGSVTRIPWREG